MERKLIKDIVLISTLTAILFVQQIALSFIPNVQLTTLLILVYTKVIGFKKTSIIIMLHVLIFNILSPFGPSLIVEIPFMIIAWIIFSLVSKLLRENVYVLATFGFLFGFIYGFILIIPAVLIMDSPFLPYLISDIPFEILMALANFITIIWLYDRMKSTLDKLVIKYYNINWNKPITGLFFCKS